MSLTFASDTVKFIPYTKNFDLNDGVTKKNRLSKAQIAVYGYIYSWCESGYYCPTSEIKMARYLNCVKSTIELAVKKLEDLGWITVIHGKRPDGAAKNANNSYSIKRKPKALRAPKAVKAPKQPKTVKTAAEQRLSTVYGMERMMCDIGIDYDTRMMIKSTLLKQVN